jgi:hypothetical protein
MSFRIENLNKSSTSIVWLGSIKVAILFRPVGSDEPYQLYPHPGTYRTLDFAGLPAPLRPEFMSFPTLAAVEAFLGISTEAETPESLPKAA